MQQRKNHLSVSAKLLFNCLIIDKVIGGEIDRGPNNNFIVGHIGFPFENAGFMIISTKSYNFFV